MIKKIIRHPFISATAWMTIGSGFLSGGNFLYHFLMGRLLGIDGYGALESIIALLYILSIPLATFSLVIVKFVSSYKGKQDMATFHSFYNFVQKRLVLYGLLFSFFLLITLPFVSNFLHLPVKEIPFLLALASFTWGFNNLDKATLQGLSKFFHYSLSNIGETIAKLIISVSLVLLGFGVGGAFFGMVLSAFVGYAIAHAFVRKLDIKKHNENFSISRREILHFGIPVLLMNAAFTSLYTTDILLVRHFFPGTESGYYAALSTLGKIIFFAASPVVLVMFPFISERHASKKKFTHLLFLSLGLAIFIVSICTAFFFLFPGIIIQLLFARKEFLAVSPYLGHFAIFMSLYVVCYLLVNFYLSIQRVRAVYFTVASSILQIVLIWFFHENLTVIINMSILSSSLLLISLLLYYMYGKTSS